MHDTICDVDGLCALLERAADHADTERISILDHGLQCAQVLRRSRPHDVELQIAGLVHDLGWVVGAGADDHGDVGAMLVEPLLGGAVARLVALHVPAKRYLVGADDHYGNRLSARSIETLALQGGAMSLAERTAFEGSDSFERAIDLRRADEAAKLTGRSVRGVDSWRPVIASYVATRRVSGETA